MKKPAFDEKFRFIKPTLPGLDSVVAAYASAFSEGLVTNAGLVARFEAMVAERLGVSHCVAVSSCTSGLMLVLKSLGLTGEVIMPSFTFFATGHAAVWNNLTPVFADCRPDTWTLNLTDVESSITPRTSAIIGVHLYGNPCSPAALCELASRHNLKLIFDSAHAFGSCSQHRPIGQFGDAEVFSLSPTKLLVAGEGGLVTTNDATLAKLVKLGRNYGDSGSYDPAFAGLNARMSEFNAALGLTGLSLVDSKVSRHNEIADHYRNSLCDLPGLSFQTVLPGDVSTYKDFSVIIDETRTGISRDAIARALLEHNIETRKYFDPPLHKQLVFRNCAAQRPLPVTESSACSVLSLPIYESLPDSTIDGVCKALRSILNRPANPALEARS